MLSVLSKIIKFNTLLIVGVYNSDEKSTYYTLVIKKKGSLLNIISSSVYEDFDEMQQHIDKKLPALLLIDGKGVLSKKIDLNNETDLNWRKNIDFGLMYHLDYATPSAVFLSFSRKQHVDEIVESFGSKGIQVIDCYLGPLVAGLLLPSIGENTVYANNSVLQHDGPELYDIVRQTDAVKHDYTFGDKKISQYHLPLYGAAVHFFLKPGQISKVTPDRINAEEILYKKSFNYFGTGMLIFFLASLLTSYMLIQYYSAKNINLNEENVFTKQTYEYIVKLEESKKEKLAILNQTGQLSEKFLSFYIYELLRSVPSTIQLKELNVFPLSKEIKEKEKVEVIPNTIILKGTTATEPDFNEWFSGLKNMKWIKKFEIVSIKKDKKNIQQFEVKILL
ncbi:hypothetical protein AAEO56_11635 [Flavobacterium sp. DGU11]|uniref:Fimbrial assembly protein (PilN) n=1 Tax=Flavobacterium arundinis TaxID=3139143 RepID=A0ABU9HYB7_9FLAO